MPADKGGGTRDELSRRAVQTIKVSNFLFDQARGNFAYQADQELALRLCGGDSVRTVQMQTYVTSASAMAQFASNQLVGGLCGALRVCSDIEHPMADVCVVG